MKTPIEATYLYDIICTRQKGGFHPEEILNEIRKILVDEIWPESKVVIQKPKYRGEDVDINYDFHEGRGEDNEIL